MFRHPQTTQSVCLFNKRESCSSAQCPIKASLCRLSQMMLFLFYPPPSQHFHDTQTTLEKLTEPTLNRVHQGAKLLQYIYPKTNMRPNDIFSYTFSNSQVIHEYYHIPVSHTNTPEVHSGKRNDRKASILFRSSRLKSRSIV